METPFPEFNPNGERDPRGPRLSEIPFRMVIPNLVTVLAICAGLTGVRLAFESRFETAVIMVLVAAFLDAVDGRLARMLKASSRFGEQMDSLADAINFGVAPALVLYAFLLDRMGSFGWITVLLYVIACCLRLARFNAMLDVETGKGWRAGYFTGVPAPAGAGLVLLPVYFGFLGVAPSHWWGVAAGLYTVMIGLLMVSRVPVFSGKGGMSSIRRDLVMPVILLLVLYVLLLASFIWETLALTAIIFLASLPVSANRYFRREEAERAATAKPSDAEPAEGKGT